MDIVAGFKDLFNENNQSFTQESKLVNCLSEWYDIAEQASRNTNYYRGLVVKIGKMLGPDAYISDDGSIQDDVLCAKVPELVASKLGLKLES
jgi:hypothetical protein